MNENYNYKLIYMERLEYCRSCEMCRSTIPYDAKICRYCNSYQKTVLNVNNLMLYESKKRQHNQDVADNVGAIIFCIMIIIAWGDTYILGRTFCSWVIYYIFWSGWNNWCYKWRRIISMNIPNYIGDKNER